jgi:hypothetical protein
VTCNNVPKLIKQLAKRRSDGLSNNSGDYASSNLRSFARHLGGLLSVEVGSRFPDTAIGLAWHTGCEALAIAQQRLQGPANLIETGPENRAALPNGQSIEFGFLQKSLLNAVAGRRKQSYLICAYRPLIACIQTLSAALWAHPEVFPWIGDVSSLSVRVKADAPDPPGFEFLKYPESKVVNNFITSETRFDLRSIKGSGEARINGFWETSRKGLQFLWGHEMAHVLYGHLDFASRYFGVRELFEAPDSSPLAMPSELSQFLEYVADKDAGIHLFVESYYKLLAEPARNEIEQVSDDCAFSLLGGIVVLFILSTMHRFGVVQSGSESHPPIHRRVEWIFAAGTASFDMVSKKMRDEGNTTVARADRVIKVVREKMCDSLKSVCAFHSSMEEWITRLDFEGIEAEANSYLSEIRQKSLPYFDELARQQKLPWKY